MPFTVYVLRSLRNGRHYVGFTSRPIEQRLEEARAEGGETLASDVVRQLVAGKGFLLADHGDVELRGFEDPVRLYDVRWREDG